MKNITLFVFFLCAVAATGHAQSASHPTFFGQRAFFGTSFGADGDCQGIDDENAEIALFWSKRLGVSLTRTVYAGIQGRFILARNAGSSSMDPFYMVGLWGRFYPVQTLLRDNPGRWGFFVESGLMTGNYYREDRGETEPIVARSGRIYIPGHVGAEFRFCHGITAEAGFQFYFTAGEKWDTHGIAYPSMGLNWHIGKGMCAKK